MAFVLSQFLFLFHIFIERKKFFERRSSTKVTVDQTIPEETIREEVIPEEDILGHHQSDLDITLKDDDTYSMNNGNMDPGKRYFIILR